MPYSIKAARAKTRAAFVYSFLAFSAASNFLSTFFVLKKSNMSGRKHFNKIIKVWSKSTDSATDALEFCSTSESSFYCRR